MLSAALSLAACADIHLRSPIATTNHLQFLSHALSADDKTREAMWRNTASESGSQGAALDRALMQSVPGHSGYDPSAAESALRALINDEPSADIETVARLRMTQLQTELRANAECKQENAQLKQRLARVVDIERKLNSNGH